MAGEEYDIHAWLFLLQGAEKFTGHTLDPVALHCEPDIFPGYDKAQAMPGAVISPCQKQYALV